MYILLITVLFMAGNSDGGVHTSMQKIEFKSMRSCELSAILIRSKGYFWKGAVTEEGGYKILAKCINTN